MGTKRLEAVLAENVKRLRGGQSYRHLAGVSCISVTGLWKIENAQASATLDSVAKLAEAFGVPAHTLLQPSASEAL